MKSEIHILLDTEVFRSENLNFRSERFRRLAHYAQKGDVRIYIADVVIGEVRRSISKALREALDHLKIKEIRRKLGILSRSELADLKGATRHHEFAALVKEQEASLEELLENLKARTISTDKIDVGEMRHRYFNRRPPFGKSEAKKHEFPDAMMLLSAESLAQELPCHLNIVSADRGVTEAARIAERLEPVACLSAMISQIVATVESTAWRAEKALPLLEETIVDRIRDQFFESWFFVEDEWEGEVENVTVRDIGLSEPEIAEIEGNTAIFELVSTIAFSANVSVADPNQTAYDSETKEVYVYSHLQGAVEVERDFEVTVALKVDPEDLSRSAVLSVEFLEADIGLKFPWDER